MTARPVDENGDILPVLSFFDLLMGTDAVAAGLKDHLHLYPGDWWENPELGNEVLDLLAEARRTDRDAEALATYLVSWLMAFPGVRGVSDLLYSFAGSGFRFSCVAHTESGEAAVSLQV